MTQFPPQYDDQSHRGDPQAYSDPQVYGVRRRKRQRRPLKLIATLALVASGVTAWRLGVFSDNGEPITYAGADNTARPGGRPEQQTDVDPNVQFPTGPAATFKRIARLDDGTEIGKTTLAGPKSGFTGDVWVWTPKEYKDPAYAKSAFPVLIALPGSYGYPVNYWSGTDLGLQKAVSDGAAAGRSHPFIVVMPVLNPGNKGPFHDGSDIPGQPKMGTWMSDDVPDLVRRNFRTYTSRDGWAFMGSSTGAFVGLKQVLKHPSRFKAVIASGGMTTPDSPLWKGHQKEMDENNPEKLAEQHIAQHGPDVHLNFQIGAKEDPAGLREFVRKYGKGPIKATLRTIDNGGHNGRDYVRGMREGSLEWISKALLGPKPRPSQGASTAETGYR
ncbi:alpha/beta hydrolase [Streptomyces sp. NPDC057743]|uniref:alpha/beta hydrolase n=1 Tax=Streptomyces sp. NPDC057743 TaxID=3346236 RepID=UPI0036931961